MVVCLLPSKTADVYNRLKRLCCIEFGIPSQMVTTKMIDPNNNKSRSVITNVAVQIDCKLGAEIWGVNANVYFCDLFIKK
jgi:aubergine